jgi:mycothiol synthase
MKSRNPGGGDYMIIRDFLQLVRNNTPCRSGIHEAMDMTLPGLVSQQSVLRGGAWLEVPDSRNWGDELPKPQLQMTWDSQQIVPQTVVPPGYELRCYHEEDPVEEEAYVTLIAKAGFGTWDHQRVHDVLRHVLPDGLFVVIHQATGKLVATALANHAPREFHPFGGEMGWVAGDPEHKGKGLGLCVSAAATARLVRAGYRTIYLLTDDFRLPAIETYLRLGYEPYLFCEGMAERWDLVLKNLGRK